MDEPFVVVGLEQFGGLVRRVVVDHDDVELEAGLLAERGVNGVADGLLTVVDGYDHRCFHVELLFVEVWAAVV